MRGYFKGCLQQKNNKILDKKAIDWPLLFYVCFVFKITKKSNKDTSSFTHDDVNKLKNYALSQSSPLNF